MNFLCALLGYITDANSPDPTKSFVHHELWPLSTFTTTADVFFAYRPKLVTVVNSFACPETNGYWGDYWGLAAYRGPAGQSRTAAALTFSRIDGGSTCTLQTADIAKPMHVGFTVWK